MTEVEVEQVFETLATAIDRAGPQNEAVFLAKLALILADRLADPQGFGAAIEIALQDLPPGQPDDLPAGP